MTKAAITACKASSFKSGGHCPKGSTVLIFKIGRVNYALQAGHTPTRLGSQYGMQALAQACGAPRTAATVPVTTTAPPAVAGGIEVGPGPQTAYSVQPQPTPGSCHYSYVGAFPLPDPHCTPGATNPQVTQADIASTICRSGYTSTIRPPEDVTEREKTASAAAYGYTGSLHTAEYDHLISLELGGDPNDPANLWVEPNDKPSATSTANTKDVMENKLNELVCSGEITLAAAQQDIATNWVAAYDKYDASAVSPSAAATPSTAVPAPQAPTHATAPAPAPAPVPVTTPPSGCYPKTDSGNCYEAGELCRTSDRGASGLAGNGASIKCEDNDGWRWEPA